jgi:hypothetical protein
MPEAHFPRPRTLFFPSGVALKLTFRNLGLGRALPSTHSTKDDGVSSNEIYPALLESRLTTLTGTLTGTGYRRITPHPAKHL